MTREEAIADIKHAVNWAKENDERWCDGVEVGSLELALEALEIAHCNECKYCLRADPYELWCQGHGYPMHLVAENDFCSKGRRITEEEE